MSEDKDYKIINVSKTGHECFEKMKKMSCFKKFEQLQNKHFFLLSMSLGYKYNSYIPIKIGEKHSGGYFRVESLDDEDKSIIKAIAIAHKNNDINILSNQKEIYQIAESYANGGISILKDIISEPGDFFINLAEKCE